MSAEDFEYGPRSTDSEDIEVVEDIEESPGTSKPVKPSRGRKCACGTLASFGARAGDKPTRCSKCKLAGWIDVVHKRCQCGTQAIFGARVGDKPTRCAACKLPGWVDVRSKKCHCGKSQPSFGARAGDKPTRCAVCKLPGDVDVVTTRCHCGTRASFGARVGDRPTRCAVCKLTGWVDVRSKKCHCGKSQPSFGARAGDKPTRCSKCMLPGWVDVLHKKCHCGKSQPNFGARAGDRPTRCTECQLPGWIDVIHKRCLTDGCDIQVTDSVFCANCDPEPGRNRKVKERKVFEALCASGLVPSKYDRAMDDTSCGLSRPDFNYALRDRSILAECDENQHNPSMSNYTPECELRRMIDLHAASGGLPTIFVRFNPDPFELDGTIQKINRKSRHESLFTEIRRVMEMPAPLPGTLSVTYMFFDEVTCAGVPPSDRGILRRYVIDTCDPRFPVTREL